MFAELHGSWLDLKFLFKYYVDCNILHSVDLFTGKIFALKYPNIYNHLNSQPNPYKIQIFISNTVIILLQPYFAVSHQNPIKNGKSKKMQQKKVVLNIFMWKGHPPQFDIFLLMKSNDKICHRVNLKSQKQRQLYKKRQDRVIEGTPKIILGKAEPNHQQIWTDDLKHQPLSKLKQANNSQKGHIYAKKIVTACLALSNHYGYFMINQNMIFLSLSKDIFTWINPDICQNHVKIYLPHTHDGQLAMIKSIINYLKLWFKCDYTLLTDVKSLSELVCKIDQMRIRPQQFKAKSPQREFLANRRNSVNMDSGDVAQRHEEMKMGLGQKLLAENKSMKDVMGRSPGKESGDNPFLTSSLSNKISNPLKFANPNQKDPLKNRTTLNSDKNEDYEHRTFNNGNNTNNNTMALNKSQGVKGGSGYYPNKTTSNNKHHIVAMINQHDVNPNQYGKNKILLDQKKMNQLELERARRGKDAPDAIGQQLNDLFLSNIENQEQNEQTIKKVEQEFSSLLD